MKFRALILAPLLACSLPATLQAAEPMLDFEVTRADTLIGLSRDVLVAPDAWREVARINRLANPNQIRPGQRLRIPARLLRSEPVAATLVRVNGEVRVGTAPAVAGGVLNEGQALETGPNGSAVVALADGSQVRLPPSSLAEVAASRRFGGRRTSDVADSLVATPAPGSANEASWFSVTLRLLRGSVEVVATRVLRIKPLEVVTPTAVVGVRGTHYRVSHDNAGAQRTHGEVLEGSVRFDAATKPAGADLPSGFGAALDAAGSAPVVARLLPAPDLSAVPERFERPIVRFPAPPDGSPLRVQIAADAAFEQIVTDQRVPAGAEVRIAGLDDAPWHLRARRIDSQGIEGFDAARAFVLKARPEPPAYREPRPGAKRAAGRVEFNWAPNLEAQRARLQVAEDADFKKLLRDSESDAAMLGADLLQPGTYHWRVASIRAGGDQGPFGDPQRIEVRALPEPAAGGASADGASLVFHWTARPQDRQQVELARDATFTRVVAAADLATAGWTPPTPDGGGRYYFRYRSVEPDGFVTPYSATLVVDVPRDWSGLGLLLPLLLLF